jgi:DNA adenine methylase
VITARQLLRAPFPWFGGKSLAADMIWRAFGNVPNYVEPFAGSLAVLLARPHEAKCETANDKDGFICNFWRAVAADPDQVSHWADWPVNEADLHARHKWLLGQATKLLEKLEADPHYYDPKIAGWWVWGLCAWIGNGWCHSDERLHRCTPKIGTPGHGIHAPSRKKPLTHRNKGVHRTGAPLDLFQQLSDRLRDVRIVCGDWKRVLGRSTLGIDTNHGMTPAGILLDPPYSHKGRDKRLYREDDAQLSRKVREWALKNGDNPKLRIALCGWAGEHKMPPSWRVEEWVSKSSGKNRLKERIWFSPHCLDDGQQGSLFAEEHLTAPQPGALLAIQRFMEGHRDDDDTAN